MTFVPRLVRTKGYVYTVGGAIKIIPGQDKRSVDFDFLYFQNVSVNVSGQTIAGADS